ncbi:monooxygenase FAD-binding [Catenulispora acidiphila DSM 44928]|uniref:Monooxygenase FAD-binding n=1 Tax=Catenulispora acidiphila (strain DSM 44928 / JCM 14897 / NBRC 102108 / NRRL B-24433 / ID139908) TaxID=479433 RepID=C7Q6C5_CATAD|nr:FAD-dependent monooxygenase [Catenulispora acidiphila]ACU72131.1 monooxygenase FAD-binding [Catenulispora acidiphila DSM 44928]
MSTAQKTRTALVIGGGIAGPVTATALHKAGIQAIVYEAHAELGEGIGGGLALAPNGMAALDTIGVGDAVRAAATPIAGTRMAIDGKIHELPSLAGVEPLQIVGRGDLHRLLRERALEAGVGFEYGKRLIEATETADGVEARFADGTTASADVLIGADGVRSTVRTLIDPAAPGADYTGLLSFQGYVDAAPDLDVEPGMMTFAFGKRAYYLYWKQADGRLTWGANLPSKTYMSLTEARAIPADKWLRRLRDTYRDDTPGHLLADRTTPDTLDITGAIHIMPPVPHWHTARVALVGDAVHAPSNSTGQGASLAIESALHLARTLRDIPNPATAFATYETLRRPRVERITKRGARTNRKKTPGPLGRKVMHATMPLFFKLMNFDKVLGWEQRYRIDWEAPVR